MSNSNEVTKDSEYPTVSSTSSWKEIGFWLLWRVLDRNMLGMVLLAAIIAWWVHVNGESDKERIIATQQLANAIDLIRETEELEHKDRIEYSAKEIAIAERHHVELIESLQDRDKAITHLAEIVALQTEVLKGLSLKLDQ